MKKLLSFIIVMCMIIVSVPISASAVGICTPYNGDNSEDQNYSTYTSPIKSYLSECNDGSIMKVQAGNGIPGVLIEYYDTSYNLLRNQVVPQELPAFGGFYESANNYFLVTGQTNRDELSTTEVYRLTKYDKSWNRISDVGVYGANTTVPFNAGTARMVMSGNVMIIYTSHEMYKSSDGYNHQANVIISVDTSAMKIIKCKTSVSNNSTGYISHSFNQFIQLQGKNMVTVDHGDAHPRSIVLIKHGTDATAGNFGSNCTIKNVLNFPGEIGDNYTGASVGGFEISSTSYLIAGNTVEQDSNYYNNRTRNIFVASITGSETKINKITSFAEGEASASTPHLVKIANDTYMLMWSRNNNVYYTTLDAKGNKTSSIYSMAGNLSDCVPVVMNNKLVWYVWKNTKNIFYEINLSSISQNSSKEVEVGHSFEFVSTSNGASTVRCTKCGTTETFSVPTNMNIWWKTASNTGNSYYSAISGDLIVGETLKAMITYTASDSNMNREFDVVVSDESILKYEQKSSYSGQILGEFSLLKAGKATITFKHKYNPSLTATYNVTVKTNIKHQYEYVSTSNGIATVKCVKCGETDTFAVPTTMSTWWKTAQDTGSYYYSGINGDLTAGEALEFMINYSPTSSDVNTEFEVIISDSSILSYEHDYTYSGYFLGKFNLLKAGKATITFKHKYNPALTSTHNITVKSNATAVALNKSSLELTAGDKYTLKPALTPSNASAVYSWSSSNTAVATVDSTGTVTAKKAGTAVITLTLDNGLKATCTVKVKNSVLVGDVSMNGSVDVTDVILVLKHCVDTVSLNAEQIKAGDLNNSGDITVLDAILIQKQILDMA